MDPDSELLKRVCEAIDKKDFFPSIIFRDTFADWNLVKELGEFLVRIDPDGVLGHALLTRGHRHLGNRELGLAALKECQARKLLPVEAEVFLPLFEEESTRLAAIQSDL